jgi:hypothetical protein
MTDNRVVVRYESPAERTPGRPARFVGETYVVTDAAAAEAVHPGARITGYADGRKFVRVQDESLAAQREAEAKAAAKDAEKAAKAAERAGASKPADAPKADAVKVETKG